jgi:hypothetical protein
MHCGQERQFTNMYCGQGLPNDMHCVTVDSAWRAPNMAPEHPLRAAQARQRLSRALSAANPTLKSKAGINIDDKSCRVYP